ncbi:ESPR-type extended signal peptide-containing protein, partial [Neisseria sp. P0006.S005]|uniref:ESPR-type extended signal peptide-containing protein n=1 Tax=Neisseria sp. P0006.S005 TaxID=3436688 RepID=UPI003F7F8AC3
MNKIFKVVWNRTIQSFVVTSELAKGRVKSSAEQNSTDVSAESGKNGIATVFRLTVISAALLGAGNSYAATAARGKIEFDAVTSATAVSGATATGIGALSVGASANATANGAVAVGTSANATHNNSLAVGTNAKATQNHAVAMGADTSASSSNATAIGKSANAVSADSTALGADSKANGTQATAVGKNALADNTSTTALGNSAQAFGIGSMALGQSSTSRGQNGIAIGSGSQAAANAQNAIAIGTNAVGYQSESIAIGNSAQAQTGNTIAIGKGAVANSPGSGSAPSSAIALGADANATGLGTIAIGRASEVLSQNSMNVNVTHNNIAIGNTARVGDSSSSKITQSIAIGSGNRVDPQGRPEGAWAKGDQSIAVGGNVLANGNSSVAIGGDDLDSVGGTRYSGNATDKFIKYNEKGAKTGEYTLSGKSLRDIYKEMTGDTMNYGSYGNTIAGQGSVALGVQSNSSADLSLAIGTKSQATAFGGVALGTGAKATLLNSVALGTASKTDKEGQAYVQREIMGVTYTWAGGQTTDAGDVVSVGSKGYERQIINVSPGDISATSTDAINGSQLYGVLSALERIRYFSVKSTDGSTDGTKNWNNDGAKGANSIAIGPSASTTSAATNGVAIGNQANVTGVNAVALGNGTTASVQDSVALGNGAVGAANNFDATAKNASFKNDSGAATNVSYAASSSSKTGAVSVGSAGNERQIQNVAAGRISATSTDAVNGSQLYTVMNNVGHNIQQNGTDKSRINNNGTVNYADGNLTTVAITDGENASKVQINVTQGTLSVDNNGTVSAPTAGVATAGDVANAINNAKITTKVEAGSNTHVNKTTSGKETTYTVSADKATVQVSNALNLTSNTTTAADGSVTTDYSIDLAQDTKDDIQKGVDAKTTVDTKGLTFNGDSGSTNVEKLGSTVTVAGDDNITTEAQDDKVTVKLNKDLVVNSVKAGDTTVNNDGVKIAGGPSLTKSGIDAAGNKVTNVADGDLNANSKDAVNGSQLFATNQNVANNAANIAKGINFGGTTGSNNYALGDTINVKGDSNIISETVAGGAQLKLAKDITVDSVTAGDSKLNSDGLTITGGPSVTKSGINAAGNKITNVAPGTDDTDAVNYSQLKQQSAAARTEVAAGTNIKDVVKTTGANGQDVYTVNAKGTTASAGSNKVTVTASAEDANNVTDYSIDLAQDTKDDIQKGVDAKNTVDTKGLTFNGDSGSTNVEKLGATVTVAGDDNITTEAQDDKVTVKLNKDLVVDSVKAGDTTVNNDGVKVAGGPSLTKSGIDAAGNKVTNVADGDLNANSKDAVNGSQLFATNQNVANNAANIAKGINFGGTTGSNNYALGDTINVKGDSNIISETVAGGAQLKLAKDITVDSVTAGDSKLNSDGLTITGGPSVTKS